jgi:hypothetical protein
MVIEENQKRRQCAVTTDGERHFRRRRARCAEGGPLQPSLAMSPPGDTQNLYRSRSKSRKIGPHQQFSTGSTSRDPKRRNDNKRGLGQSRRAGQTEVHSTILGDTDLDDRVNALDLANMAGNFGLTAGARWIDGDFDNNRNVSIADLTGSMSIAIM